MSEMNVTNATLTAIRRIFLASESHGRDVAESIGLTPVQLRVLQLVQDGGIETAKALAEQMHVSQATISALLDKLVTKKMIKRRVSDQDRRSKRIEVTALGRAAIASAPDPIQQKFARRFDRLDGWEKAMILAGLERVCHLLDAEDIDAAPVLMSGDINAPSL